MKKVWRGDMKTVTAKYNPEGKESRNKIQHRSEHQIILCEQ